MIMFVSTTGGGEAVDFESAILSGFASDGGLYVPQALPEISNDELQAWSILSYVELAFEFLSLFIHRSIMSETELKRLLHDAYEPFEPEDVIPLHKLRSRKDTYVLELFHGPTLSFKDVGQSFLINLVDFFLARRHERISIIVATTGDTGPAAAYYAAGKPTMDIWVLYPEGFITEEQERQMTTLSASNVHPVSVSNCIDGGDDLDVTIASLFANTEFKNKLKLSSVNSINWGRVMMQVVHYFYAYFRVVDKVGESINMSVPSGAFGNLFAGSVARSMGLPVETYVCANNKNACLHRIYAAGILSKQDIHETVSSAMDILIPYNFWRHLYFLTGQDPEKISGWMEQFKKEGKVCFDKRTLSQITLGFLSRSVSDAETLALIKEIYENEQYLLDPHSAVAVAATDHLKDSLGGKKLVCLATAHPAKFPETMKRALGKNTSLPPPAFHHSIEAAKTMQQSRLSFDYPELEAALIEAMESQWDLVGRQVSQ